MQRKDKWTLIIVAVLTFFISFLVAKSIFNSPAKHSLKAPTVESIPASFPDVKNDSNYNTFLNNKALDPTQPVQIGNTQNQNPF
jgi:hypothetical protein